MHDDSPRASGLARGSMPRTMTTTAEAAAADTAGAAGRAARR